MDATGQAHEIRTKLDAFMDAHIYRNEARFFTEPEVGGASAGQPVVEELKPQADRASEVDFTNVRVPVANILLGKGRGFQIARGRLELGRIHHCMRLIGLAERMPEKMCRRAQSRIAFGKALSEQTLTQERIAEARIMIEQSRLLVARAEIAMIKVGVPDMTGQVIHWAIQLFGGGGAASNDYGLALAYANARLLRIADGPEEVHRNQIARLDLRSYPVERRAARI